MDPSDLPERLRRAGRSQADLARHLGLDPSSLTKTIKGGRRLKADELLSIEQFFEGSAAQGGAADVRGFAPGRRLQSGPRKIPVFGYAAGGGEERVAFNEGQVAEWIDPPPFGVDAGEFFGVRVLSDSMEPRFFEGELAIAQRNLPPARDRDCIVEFRDGSGLIKTYRGQRNGLVMCRQWNPDRPLEFPGASVKALHAVVWRR